MLTDRILRDGDLDAIRKIPKADVHAHMILSAPFSAYQEVFDAPIEPPPKVFQGGLLEFLQYLKTSIFPNFKHPEQLKYILHKMFEHMISDGITYTELSCDIRLPTVFGLSWDEFIILFDDVASQNREYITVRPELGVARETDDIFWRENAAKALATGYFQSIDLYGDELAHEISHFTQYLQEAKNQGLKIKIHSGEVGSASRVLHEYEQFQPDAIQHGIRTAEDDAVLSTLATSNVTFNVCPASNVALRVVDDYASHPLAAMIRAGMRVTVNTDDYAIFGTSLSDEYLRLFQTGLLTASELESVRQNGLKENTMASHNRNE